MSAIKTEGLTRRFGDFTAVDHISFNVEQGEVFGFLGPNGSGKTTVIKMLTGILPITEGKAWVDGIDVSAEHEDHRPAFVLEDVTRPEFRNLNARIAEGSASFVLLKVRDFLLRGGRNLVDLKIDGLVDRKEF